MLARFLNCVIVGLGLALFSLFSNAATVSYAPSFAKGWNLVGNSVSVPLDVKASFSGKAASLTSIWKWNVATSRWAFYAPSLDANGTLADYCNSKGYDVLTTVAQGEGFWVNAAAATTLGTQSGSGVSLAAANMTKGWNLAATGDDITAAAFTTNVGNVTTLWAWDNVSSAWYFYAPSLAASNGLASYIGSKGYQDFGTSTLSNGRGFWVNYAGVAGGGTAPVHGTLQATNAPTYVGNFTPAIPTAISKTVGTVTTHTVTWTETHTPNTVVEKLDVTFHAPGSSGFTAGTPISIQYLVSDAGSGAALPATLINCAQTPAACAGLTINTSTNIATFANLVVDGVTLTGTLSYLPPSTSGGGTGGGTSTLTWASGTSGTSNELSGIAFGNNLYVAVGNGGTILTSADGASWTARSSGSTKWLLDVVWSGSQFVVVGDFGVLLTSPDGINWTSRSSGTGTGISGIAWNGTKFVATAGGAVLTSTNGVSWTSNSVANTSFYYGSGVITWDGTQFVAIGGQQGGVILTSSGGLTWVSHPASAGPLSSVIWTGSQFTAVGYPNTLVTSPDATTWTARTSGTPNGSFLNGIAWSGTSYVLVGDGGKIRQSSDAITWTANTSGTANTLNDVVFGGGRFVTVGQGGTILKSQLLN